MMTLNIPKKDVSKYIRALAESNGVFYSESKLDKVAQVVTRLAGDDVKPDEVEGLLMTLNRDGFIAASDMIKLHSRYLDEVKASTGNNWRPRKKSLNRPK